MEPQGGNDDRAAVCVVAGIHHILKAEGGEYPAPGMQGIKAFQDSFARIIQFPIAQQKSHAAKTQVPGVVVADAVADEDEADAVVLAAPTSAVASRANLPGLIHFGVGVGFVLALVPSPTPKETQPIGERLFEVDAESVFHRGLK